jgi:hypothetical protein
MSTNTFITLRVGHRYRQVGPRPEWMVNWAILIMPPVQILRTWIPVMAALVVAFVNTGVVTTIGGSVMPSAVIRTPSGSDSRQ